MGPGTIAWQRKGRLRTRCPITYPPLCRRISASTASSPAIIHLNLASRELAKITMVEAIAMAHGWEMQHDANVVVIGQDVGANCGVFLATPRLQERFAKDRLQDTPPAEATMPRMTLR